MDDLSAMRIMKNEQSCVYRAEAGCSRECGRCDLIMDSSMILEAYDYVIRILEGRIEDHKL